MTGCAGTGVRTVADCLSVRVSVAIEATVGAGERAAPVGGRFPEPKSHPLRPEPAAAHDMEICRNGRD